MCSGIYSEPTSPTPKRARIQNTTQEVQRLYDRSKSQRLSPLIRTVPSGPIEPQGHPQSPPQRSVAPHVNREMQKALPYINNGRDGPRDVKQPRRSVRRSVVHTKSSEGPDWTTDELTYLESKEQSNMKTMVAFQPAPISKEALSGMGPALAVGERGMSEAVQEKLRIIEKTREVESERLEMLARMRINGMKVDCRSKRESDALEQRVKQILDGGDQQSEDSHPISDEQKEGFTRKLLGGGYILRHADAGDVVGNVERLANRNTSYLPEDESSLLQKFKTMLPAVQAAAAKKPARAQR